MSSHPLNHDPSPSPRYRRRCLLWKTLTLFTLPLLAIAASSLTFRQVESRMDPVTGSITWKTTWPFGITSAPRTDVSPLETRLKFSRIAWTPSWQYLNNTHRNIFGIAICHECGTAPQIFQLRPALKDFAAVSTDTELHDFVRIMQSGAPAEQNAAVETAFQKSLIPARNVLAHAQK